MNGRKFAIGVLVVVVTVSLAARLAEAAEKMQYRLKLEEGKKYYVRLTMEGNTFYTIMGRERPREEAIGFGYNFDVNEVDENGSAWVKCTFDWIKLRHKSPGREVVYDSTQLFSPVAPSAKRLSLLLGASFQMKTTPLGKVEQVKGIKTMFENIGGKISDRKRERPTLESLRGQFNGKSIKGLFERFLDIYPKDSVGVGDSWRKTTVAPLAKPVIAENIWTLKERKNGIAIIQNKADIRPDPNAKPTVRGNTKTSYKLEGVQNGMMEVDESTGLIRECKLNQELTGETKIVTKGKETTENIIPMKTKGVLTFQMTERKEETEQEEEVVQ